jgi:hypothetical protein
MRILLDTNGDRRMRWPKLASGVANSCRPRAMLLRATPVAPATAEMPPRPRLCASAAAKRR